MTLLALIKSSIIVLASYKYAAMRLDILWHRIPGAKYRTAWTSGIKQSPQPGNLFGTKHQAWLMVGLSLWYGWYPRRQVCFQVPMTMWPKVTDRNRSGRNAVLSLGVYFSHLVWIPIAQYERLRKGPYKACAGGSQTKALGNYICRLIQILENDCRPSCHGYWPVTVQRKRRECLFHGIPFITSLFVCAPYPSILLPADLSLVGYCLRNVVEQEGSLQFLSRVEKVLGWRTSWIMRELEHQWTELAAFDSSDPWEFQVISDGNIAYPKLGIVNIVWSRRRENMRLTGPSV